MLLICACQLMTLICDYFICHVKCNKQEYSWEYGYNVMSWIRTIIRSVIKDDWIEVIKYIPFTYYKSHQTLNDDIHT